VRLGPYEIVARIGAGRMGEVYRARDTKLAAISVNQRFEVSRDGRFLLPVLVEQEGSTPMTVVLNWPELLRRK